MVSFYFNVSMYSTTAVLFDIIINTQSYFQRTTKNELLEALAYGGRKCHRKKTRVFEIIVGRSDARRKIICY